MPASAPIRLRVPAIGLDSALVQLGLDGDGVLEVPPGAHPAGWYEGSPTPGSLGPAIISGHVDYGGEPGVFVDLREVAPDDEIAVEREDGTTAVFRVTRVTQVPKSGFPTDEVYGDLDHAGLRLITCGGSFDRGARSYEDNVVVFAALAAPTAPATAAGAPHA
jgi:sortase (surface protein transpeptidase)